MQNESIQTKQQYLRQNIIDAGYDAEEFVQFCSNQHQLSDLADWTIDKLKYVVKLYIKRQQQCKAQNKFKSNEEDSQWSNFQQAPSVPFSLQATIETKKQHQNHHNTTKSGHIVFSEDDWAIFLGGVPSHLASNTQKPISQVQIKKTETIQFTQKRPIVNLNFDKEKGVISNQKEEFTPKKSDLKEKNSFENTRKQNPLTPPTQQIKKQISAIRSPIDEGIVKTQNRGPINFTNIKLQTNKVKPLPKLPQINNIIINKTEQISRNFLQSDYTLYYIHFLPGNHTIQRKFTDLRKLRSLLHGLYPHIRLPYLEPEGWLTSSQGKDTETLAKYKWMVLDFLKYIIIRNEELKNCPLVRKFCGFTTSIKSSTPYQEISKSQLKYLFESFETLSKPKKISQLCLGNNFIILPSSNDCQKLINNTITILQEVDHEYEKLKKKLQNLFYYYDCLAKAMNDVSGSFETLQGLIKKSKFENDQLRDLRVYEGIREMCNKMHNSLNEQCVIFKTRVKNILRFQKDNMMTLKQLFDSRNKIHNQYSKQGYPNLSKNSQSGNGQLQIESNISIDQPCKNNKNLLCVQQVFWSHFIKTQINSYFEQLRHKINQQLTIISYEQLDNENDNLNFWNSMIKKSVV